jgi:hypothetical protein
LVLRAKRSSRETEGETKQISERKKRRMQGIQAGNQGNKGRTSAKQGNAFGREGTKRKGKEMKREKEKEKEPYHLFPSSFSCHHRFVQ